MKKNHILAFSIILFFCFSCSITNRRYMPGVAISWKKTNIGEKSKKKTNKNTKFKEQKISVAKLDFANKGESSAFEKKQIFNTRAQKSKPTFFQRKTIQKLTHKETKIKREGVKSLKSNIKENHLIFMQSPQDSIKKQDKKPISPKDKGGVFFATYSIFSALTSPLSSLVIGFVGDLLWIENAYAFGATLGILSAILLALISFLLFKNAKKDKNINNFREFQKQRKTWLILCLSMILLSIPLNYFLITAVFL